MKLKKIASLMLAGIMAVSMLAGCKSGTPDPKPNEGEEENTASGYSAMLGEKAADDLYKADRDKIFTFADNADHQKALEKVIRNNVSQNAILSYIGSTQITNAGTMSAGTTSKAVYDDYQTEVDAVGGITGWFTTESLNDTVVSSVWVANGDIAMSNVMDTIFESCKDTFKEADEEGTFGAPSTTVDVNYKYEVSVSGVNEPVKIDTTKAGSVNFIAVTVTRTVA